MGPGVLECVEFIRTEARRCVWMVGTDLLDARAPAGGPAGPAPSRARQDGVRDHGFLPGDGLLRRVHRRDPQRRAAAFGRRREAAAARRRSARRRGRIVGAMGRGRRRQRLPVGRPVGGSSADSGDMAALPRRGGTVACVHAESERGRRAGLGDSEGRAAGRRRKRRGLRVQLSRALGADGRGVRRLRRRFRGRTPPTVARNTRS